MSRSPGEPAYEVDVPISQVLAETLDWAKQNSEHPMLFKIICNELSPAFYTKDYHALTAAQCHIVYEIATFIYITAKGE